MKCSRAAGRLSALSLILPALLLWTGFAFAEEGYQVGQLSLAEIRQKSTSVRQSLEKIAKAEADAKAKLKALFSDLKALEEELAKGEEKLSDEEKKALDEKIAAKREELQREQELARVKLSFLKRSEQNRFQNSLERIIQKVSSEKNLDLVLTADSVIYGPKLTDITPGVIKLLDAVPAQPKPENKGATKPAPAEKKEAEKGDKPADEPKVKEKAPSSEKKSDKKDK